MSIKHRDNRQFTLMSDVEQGDAKRYIWFDKLPIYYFAETCCGPSCVPNICSITDDELGSGKKPAYFFHYLHLTPESWPEWRQEEIFRSGGSLFHK